MDTEKIKQIAAEISAKAAGFNPDNPVDIENLKTLAIDLFVELDWVLCK